VIEAIERLSAELSDRYVIERELGAGGMATVYLAQDIRHQRKVALKVLRPELAAILGGERFLNEIRTTANLQHPHILPLHDSGEAAGLVYYVMPYVEGESLRDRLLREHQLPLDDAIRIAQEIGDALDYAHRHGVVHRDIKPENILLHDGRVQVADFGIALAVSTAGGDTRMTETGMSLGTPHYMAPEQAMGEKEITPKADVYALGCVLYEMLVGEPPFTGPTAQAIIARVMTEEPRSLTTQRRSIPPYLQAVVWKGLEKLPADRFASAAQFVEALTHPGSMALPDAGRGAEAAGTRETRAIGLLARLSVPLAVVAVVATAIAVWALTRPDPVAPVTRYGLYLPQQQDPAVNGEFEIAPDGSRLAFVRIGPSGLSQLWIKERERYDATPLQGTEPIGSFTFSPDGSMIAYTQGGQLKKIPVLGGAAITLADSVSGNPGLAWLDDGRIVYVQVGARELRLIPDVGGPSTIIWADTVRTILPVPLPGSRGLLFTSCDGGCLTVQDVWALDLESGEAKRVLVGAAKAAYAPTGHLIYVRADGGMLAVPFDLDRRETTGPPVPIMDSVAVVNSTVPLFTISTTGTLVVRSGSPMSSIVRHEIVWVDRQGHETIIDSTWHFRMQVRGANRGWALSPDGSRLAIGLNTPSGDDIWVKQLPTGPVSRVSFDNAPDYRPRWSPDGKTISYGSFRTEPSNDIFRRPADGTGTDEVALDLEQPIYEGVWSGDGRWLLARTGGEAGVPGGRDIFGLLLGQDSVPRPIVVTPTFDEAAIALSPDTRWLAYESNETGRTEVFIRPFPNTESAKTQVSNNGGRAPLWARNGKEFFYVNSNREILLRTVEPGSPLRLGPPQTLFRMRDELYLEDLENYTPFDISPDGSRFIMTRRVRPTNELQARMIVVDNWFTELRQKMVTP
jgi:serine/threonine-protein kinase